jgi:signal-transduction protein with cAMP-binding, CBS, and nucleotidyltransferase domain
MRSLVPSCPLAFKQMFRALGLRYVLVSRHGQLVGIIKKKDILEHIELYHRKGASPAHPHV